MKAADIKPSTKPPRVFTLAPRCFSEGWRSRPKDPLRVGMRVASADERLLAHTRAVKKADELLKGVPHEDAEWQKAYDIIRFHVLLSYTLTDPDDVTRPLWATQEGQLMDFQRAPLGTASISPRLSVEGIDRVYMELEILTVTVTSKALWQPLPDAAARTMGEALAGGSFFSTISNGEGPDDTAEERRKGVEMQIRRLLTYVEHLRATGYAPSLIDP